MRRRARRPQERSRSTGRSTGVLLGHLTELVLEDGRTMGASKLRGTFLGWMPRSNDFAVVTKVGSGSVKALTAADRRIFSRFHQTETKKAGVYDWPAATGLRKLGRLKSLTYVVPNSVKSPQKRGFRWVHAFGDHGESGHGEHTETKQYPTRLMPMLCKAANGSLHIKRMPGNRYNVTEWIYW